MSTTACVFEFRQQRARKPIQNINEPTEAIIAENQQAHLEWELSGITTIIFCSHKLAPETITRISCLLHK